jgi:thiol:disulfide interchange protein DsbD
MARGWSLPSNDLSLFAWLLGSLILIWGGVAAANPVSTDNVTARLLVERKAAAPGGSVDLALVLDIRPGWHTYWENPGDSGEPPRIDWTLPEGVHAGPLQFPYPELIRVGPLANYGYSGQAVHLISLELPADWPAGEPVPLSADASWLVCEDTCIPEEARLVLTLPTGEHAGPADLAVADLFAKAREGLPRPLLGTAELERGPGSMGLRIPADALPPGAESLWFFPAEWGLIDHAAPQDWRLAGGDWRMTLPPGLMAGRASTSGVLAVSAGGGRSAFRLDPAPAPAQAAGATPAEPGLGLPLALLFALIGGVILNLMPCVFPVLAMKVLHLASHGQVPRRERVVQGLAYTGGVLAFFALVAGLLLALRTGGAAVGWGYQLQYPPFVALMAYLFFVLGLGLSGMVTIGARLMGLGAAGPSAGAPGAFITGGLAALVAAPCTAPFMGAALGYGLTLPWYSALAVMLTLGLGLALPFLLLALAPGMARFLPRPGAWMETLKQFLAFPLFATAVWLVWVLAVQTGPDGVAAVLAGMVLLALGLWARERTLGAAGRRRALGTTLAVAALAASLGLGARLGETPQDPAVAWRHADGVLAAEPFSAERLADARAAGRPVLVNMTAAWCITCLVNERVALSSPRLAGEFSSRELLYLKGDWTNRDPEITAYLEGYGRTGVPLYVLYLPGREPQVLPQILTEGMVLAALDRIAVAD